MTREHGIGDTPSGAVSLPSGISAEDVIADELVARGFSILDRRLRIGRLEVDLLVRKGDVVVVVEVRGRRVDALVTAIDTIDWKKQRHLARAARALWSRRFAKDTSVRIVRIDVATVTWGPGPPVIEIFEGAVDPALR